MVPMKLGSTLLLKVAVLSFGAAIFALCMSIVRVLLTEEVGGYRPILIGMLIAAMPFYAGMHQVFRLLMNIDRKRAFTESSARALRNISVYGFAISAMYGLGMPYIFLVADGDDAPGVVLIGLICTFAPLAVAVIAMVLKKLLINTLAFKAENDLTV